MKAFAAARAEITQKGALLRPVTMAKVAAPPAEATTTGIDHFHAHGWATFEGVFERER